METVTVSPKFQVVIPKEIREKLKLKPGQKLQIIEFNDRIEFVPVKDIKEARGFLKGMNTKLKGKVTGYEFSWLTGWLNILQTERMQNFLLLP